MERGLVHLYIGDGKGKTTCAMGLALRALGHQKRVVILQFLKDGTSGELIPIRNLGAAVIPGMDNNKFVFQMTEEEKAALKERQTALLKSALNTPCDLLLLDEACAALSLDTVDEEVLKSALEKRNEGCELVLTGRDPAQWMVDSADYITEMKALRHPYEQGVAARPGIEY